MAFQTDQKDPLARILPDFGKGKYFLFSAFSFLTASTILSLQLHSIWEWAIGLGIFLCIAGAIFRTPFILVGSVFPIIAAMLITTELYRIENRQEEASHAIGTSTTFTGTIIDVWSVKKWQQRVTLEFGIGKVFAKVPSHYSLLLGREIYFEKPVFEPGNEFESSRWILGDISYREFRLWEIRPEYRLLSFKSSVIERIRAIFPPPASALVNGILVGDDSLMDEDFSNLYRTIGLSHITVVSGSNIAAILAVFLILLQKFPIWFKTGLSIMGLVVYVLVVGMDPPVLRALVMGSLSLLALTYGERVDSLRLLAFTAALLVAISPLSLVYDAGFQLSFLATLGILVSIRMFKKKHVLLQALGVSICAGIWTLPISIWSFGAFHLWSIPANVLAWPAVEFSMFTWALTLIVDIISPSWGHAVGYLPYFSLAWIQKIAEVFSAMPLQVQFPESVRPLCAFLAF